MATKTNTSTKLIPVIRGLMAFIAVAYLAATLFHIRLFTEGAPDIPAAVAEVIIIVVLIVGLVLSKKPGRQAVKAMFVALLVTLLITLLGMTIVLLTLTPETMTDLLIHLSILVFILVGLGLTLRARRVIF